MFNRLKPRNAASSVKACGLPHKSLLDLLVRTDTKGVQSRGFRREFSPCEFKAICTWCARPLDKCHCGNGK